MSVLLVTVDDGDDDIQIPQHEHLYQQLREFQSHYSSLESSFSIVANRKTSHHRRRSRPQQCLVKHLLTLMITLLFLTNHLHWSIIFFSISSIKFMSTYASTTTTTSTKLVSSMINEQQCLPINSSYIDRICSKTCRAQRTPFETLDHINELVFDSHYLPFCSNHTLNHSINRANFSSELSEKECRMIFTELIAFDEEARKTSTFFATYMQAIDSGSKENRYSLIDSDCEQAYRTWACSVKIPYFHQNRRVPPCQTICDEVERVCPTFRPSDHEPLFAGQPLFFCNGGLLTNSDYGQRPFCFDSCHLTNRSFEDHSVSSSSREKTTPNCFQIELLPPSPSKQMTFPTSLNESIINQTSNASLSASAISIISFTWSSILLKLCTFFFVLRRLIGRQEFSYF